MLVMPIIQRTMDANFHYYAQKMGVEVVKDKQHNVDE
jgi:hypothetical protein